MGRRYTIKEFDSFTRNAGVKSASCHPLPERVFDRLEQFILSRKGDAKEAEVLEFMAISSKRGIGKVISAKNYVGLITMRDGTQIEILPKLYTKDKEGSELETKRIFLDMLKCLDEIPYKVFHMSNLQIAKNSIFEIFIRMFIDEVQVLARRGLKSAYIPHEGNEFFFKGKLNVAQQIKANWAHKERFYIEYDTFSINRPENRLIKTTLDFLSKTTASRNNQKDLQTLLMAFETVEYSHHPDQDFGKVTMDRNMKDYETVLKWCSIFLRNKSMSTFAGDGVAYALLFPMEKVFERYIAGQLNKLLHRAHYGIKTQDRSHHLFDAPKRFLLKPDIVVRDQKRGSTIVLDTKWKQLDSGQSNFGISQADMYQVYVYQRKYESSAVVLLYPWTPRVGDITEPIAYRSKDNVTVHVRFVDLIHTNESLNHLVGEMEEVFKSVEP